MGPAKKKANPAVFILVAVALIAVGVGVYFMVGNGDDSTGSPEETARAFINAANDQDCNAALDLISTASLQQAGTTRDQLAQECQAGVNDTAGSGPFSEQTEILDANVTNETDTNATVAVHLTSPSSGEQTLTFPMVNEDGDWLIDWSTFITTLGGGGTGDGGDTTTTTAPSGGGGGTSGDPTQVPADDPTASSETLGQAQQCHDGDMTACDQLWINTSVGSQLEEYGRTCGGRDTAPDRIPNSCQADFG